VNLLIRSLIFVTKSLIMMPSKKIVRTIDCYTAKRFIVIFYLVNTWDVQSYIYPFKFQKSAYGFLMLQFYILRWSNGTFRSYDLRLTLIYRSMRRKHSLDSKGKYFLAFLLLSDISVSAPDTGKFLKNYHICWHMFIHRSLVCMQDFQEIFFNHDGLSYIYVD
jgi:hypothetical protein